MNKSTHWVCIIIVQIENTKYSCFQFSIFVCACLFDIDNPMVILGYPQASGVFLEYLARNENGNMRQVFYPAVDPKEVTLDKFKQLLPDKSTSDFMKMKEYAKICFMSSLFGVGEVGTVNNCPFNDTENVQYRLSMDEINPKCQGLYVYV